MEQYSKTVHPHNCYQEVVVEMVHLHSNYQEVVVEVDHLPNYYQEVVVDRQFYLEITHLPPPQLQWEKQPKSFTQNQLLLKPNR